MGDAMKKRGKHPDRSLTAVDVRTRRRPGRYADGNGLYLVVDLSGAKRWVLRTIVRGRRCDMGLGSVQLVSLADAREAAAHFRRSARAGGDPIAERRSQRIIVPTFEGAARTVHTQHSAAWRNGKHNDQWLNTLRDYVFPVFGGRPVNEISTADVLRALEPIWLAKPETARRVRQRIKTVLDWAKASGFRSGDNPVEGVVKGLPRRQATKKHHAAMPYAAVPEFVVLVSESLDGSVSLAFRFLILTASRTSEVLQARWCEIDFDGGAWAIPGSRMKSGRDHRVPLSQACLAILHEARRLACDSELVFPGSSLSRPLSNMAFLMLLRRMHISVTVHGFRSSFRDWSSETTNFSRAVCEMALAHAIGDKTEAAYRRGDLFEKRRKLMQAWSDFCVSKMNPSLGCAKTEDAMRI